MQNSRGRLLGVRAPLLVMFSLLLTFAPVVRGQESTKPLAGTGLRRYEIGIKTADIRTLCVGSNYDCPVPSFAIGVGGAINFTPHLALDTDFLITPSDSISAADFYGGHASEFLTGIRGEIRARHYGFYLEAQPGMFRWSHVISQVIYPTPTTFAFKYGTSTHFVSSVGAGAEYSPSNRIHVRIEVADLIYRYSSEDWLNNLQPSVGVFYSLGKPISWNPPVYNPSKNPPFVSPVNLVLLTGSTLAMTADAITTQRFISHGDREGDPFARPLVKYGWSGEIAAMSIELSGETLTMYGLHRMGHPWIERMVPVCLAITHGIFAYNNTKLSYTKGAK